MKDKYLVREYAPEKFLEALKAGVIKSKAMYEKAKEIDGRVSSSPISHEDILAIIDSFMTKKSDYNKVDGKFALKPYGRVCMDTSLATTNVILNLCLASVLTYNSAIIYSYSMENYAMNMYVITLINETLKRFLAVNYIMLQIGEAPKIVKNLIYISYDNNLKYSLKKGGKVEDFTLNCLLVKSRIKWF